MEAPEPAAGVESNTIISGDSLSMMAKNHYGNARVYTKLSEANREVIKGPGLYARDRKFVSRQ